MAAYCVSPLMRAIQNRLESVEADPWLPGAAGCGGGKAGGMENNFLMGVGFYFRITKMFGN